MSRIDRRTLVATTLATALGNIVRPSWGFARETEPDGHTGNVTTFGEDVTFVRRHAKVIVLSNPQSQARVAVCPDMQGRVLTSSAAGDAGASFGWINHELIASGKNNPQFNAFGGEDRFWLGPEGGQFGLYFKPGKPFDLQNWCVPKPINEEPFEMAQRQKNRALFRKKMHVTNYSGTRFDIDLRREICLLTAEQIRTALSVALAPQVSAVAFQSDNRITNIGTSAWEKRSGLPSIWIIGKFRPSTSATVVIPIVPGDEDELGPAVRHYFGQVPAERLTTTKSHIFFRGDGMQRGKIGVSRKRARPVMGSYDARSEVLTVVQYTLPRKATDYVNSTLEIQKAPYDGDVVNSYNDGPLEPGGQPFGPFFELETSSLAAKLKPGDSMRHVHRTFHFQGPKQHLDALSKAVLGVELKEIEESL